MNVEEKPVLNSILFILFFMLASPLMANEELSIEDIRELQELKLGESVTSNDGEKFLELQTTVQREEEEEECVDCIYGYSLFVDTPTTFALSTNIPIPPDYVLGPGDKLDIQYFGNNKSKSSEFLSRNGSINLPLLGPISVAGMDFRSAQELIKNLSLIHI